MSRSPSPSADLPLQPARSPPSSPPALQAPPPPNSNELPPALRRTEEVVVRVAPVNIEEHAEVGPAPKACDRCVRTGKTCRGTANARCEYCKRLKQKCSNSTGPARGKHAAAARLAASGALPGKAPLVPHVISFQATASAPAQGQKRKVEDRQDGPSFRRPLGPSTHAREEEESDYDGHDLPARFNKKRRTATSGAILASRVLRHVRELEESVRRLEDIYKAQTQRVDSVISVLLKEMEGLTGESHSERELSL